MQKTLSALITDVEHALYQSAGPGVQLYARDIISKMIQEAYEHCIKQEFWPQFRKREERTLDGATGQVTAPFTFIRDWEDIQHVFRAGSDRPLPILPASFNTLDTINTLTPKFIEASGDDKLFTIYPKQATGNIVVVGRRSNIADLGTTDMVPFDALALKHYAAWSYFTDDASNPASAAKHQGLFEARMAQIKNDAFGHSVQLNPQTGYVPDRWYER